MRANGNSSGAGKKKNKQTALSAPQLAVIVGLLTNSLKVKSILIDDEQTVEILLEGSLRRKTKMDALLEEAGDLPLNELLDSIARRL